ncbi:hypothetical protein HY091_03430 [Candidatus Kaiserbacteria bacterium]|nr:hypothetical protein [Candidatus Kaiserbacteria bacterium]
MNQPAPSETHTNGMQAHQHPVERITKWIGSVQSLVFHSVLFLGLFALTVAGIFPRDLVLLVWNTIVSLEAIYLAIFIQLTVNRHSEELEEVGEDVEVIQETVDELGEGVEDIQDTVEEMTEDEQREEERKQRQAVTLESLTADVKRVLTDLEALKKGSYKGETPGL